VILTFLHQDTQLLLQHLRFVSHVLLVHILWHVVKKCGDLFVELGDNAERPLAIGRDGRLPALGQGRGRNVELLRGQILRQVEVLRDVDEARPVASSFATCAMRAIWHNLLLLLLWRSHRQEHEVFRLVRGVIGRIVRVALVAWRAS